MKNNSELANLKTIAMSARLSLRFIIYHSITNKITIIFPNNQPEKFFPSAHSRKN